MSADNGAASNDEAREQVRWQVRAIRDFYGHAAVYAIVISMLVLINIASGDAWHGSWWVQWAAMPWGVLVLLHGILAFRSNALFGPDWERRKMEELLGERDRRRSL